MVPSFSGIRFFLISVMNFCRVQLRSLHDSVKALGPKSGASSTRVFVGSLPTPGTSRSLYAQFEKYGVKSIKLVTFRSKNFGFVDFLSHEGQTHAIKDFSDPTINKNKIDINIHTSRDEYSEKEVIIISLADELRDFETIRAVFKQYDATDIRPNRHKAHPDVSVAAFSSHEAQMQVLKDFKGSKEYFVFAKPMKAAWNINDYH